MKYAGGTTATMDQVIANLTSSRNRTMTSGRNFPTPKTQAKSSTIRCSVSSLVKRRAKATTRQRMSACRSIVPQCSREGETLEFHGGLNRYICSSFLLDTINNIKTSINMMLAGPTSTIGDVCHEKKCPGKKVSGRTLFSGKKCPGLKKSVRNRLSWKNVSG